MKVKRTLSTARTWLVRRVYHAPTWFNGLVDFVVDHVVVRVIDVAKSWKFNLNSSSVELPRHVPVPRSGTRVLVAPANYAGQGKEWARAISSHVADAGAVNLAIEIPGRLQFEADRVVPEKVNRFCRDWQTRELAHVTEHFTHVLVEAENAVFGSLFRGRPSDERQYLETRGLSVAYIAHGTDVRSPRRHIEATPFSPFREKDVYVDRVQRRVDRNLRFLENGGVPVFVSTPDLVDDVPQATWVPVVIDLVTWARPEAEPKSHQTPQVLHAPSLGSIKGTDLIRAAVTGLADRGVVEYSEISGLPLSLIREAVLESDIVLDQFRLGSYGVAACEAMAAGKVVVGHVTRAVREYVLTQTGLELPIVEATPETLSIVLQELACDPVRMADIGLDGRTFVREVHDGRLSALRLERHWIRKR